MPAVSRRPFPTHQVETRQAAEQWLKAKRFTPSYYSASNDPTIPQGYSAYLCYDASGYTKYILFVNKAGL